MPYAPQGVTVEPNAQTVVVTITEQGGGTPTVYTDRTAQSTIAMPATITGRTTFYLTDNTTFTVSCKVGGLENANGNGGTAQVDLTGGGFASLGVSVPVETPGVTSSTNLAPDLVAVGAGIDPTGVADSTTALQAKINATPHGGWLYIPAGTYKITSALTITQAIKITGAGVHNLFGTGLGPQNVGLSIPNISPYMLGTVLVPSTAGQNGLHITVRGEPVHLADFGINFASTIAFSNTGNGINTAPPTATAHAGFDSGLFDAKWDNITVRGHDGNHYAYNVVNSMYCTASHMRSYGGGGWRVENNADFIDTGNLVLVHPYSFVYVAGSAHGMLMQSTITGRRLNYITMTRPQSWVGNLSLAGITPPTAAQKQFQIAGTGDVQGFSISGPDFETNVGSTPNLPTKSVWIDSGGFIQNNNVWIKDGQSYWDANNKRSIDGYKGLTVTGAEPNGYNYSPFTDQSVGGDTRVWGWSTDGTHVMQMAGPMRRNGPSVASVTAGAGMGTTPPAIGGNAQDVGGTVAFGTGTAPAAGALFSVVFKTALAATPAVILTPTGAAANALGMYVSAVSATGFTVGCTGTPAASQAASTYVANYFVLG